MKKLLAILLSLCLLCAAIAGCNKTTDDTPLESTQAPTEAVSTQQPSSTTAMPSVTTGVPTVDHNLPFSVWDGSIASSFPKGNGSKEDPYQITAPSQLAFLAKEINYGKNYTGKYFSLQCNIDLAGLEWTPIGNGLYSFSGFFDGKGYTIKNLKVTTKAYNAQNENFKYVAGLFGRCADAALCDLNIENAEIIVQRPAEGHPMYVGVLLGYLSVSEAAQISGVKISCSKITTAFKSMEFLDFLCMGGLAGYVSASPSGSAVRIWNNQSDIEATVGNCRYGTATLLVGGLVGSCTALYLCDVRNCASYLSVLMDPDQGYGVNNMFGAFGRITIHNNVFSATNVFSKVCVNKVCDTLHGYPAYTANAIAGEVYPGKQNPGNIEGSYQFENVFGYVEQTDFDTKETTNSLHLYDIANPNVRWTETNCQGCQSLPAAHGFDEAVWNLQDLSFPKLK